MTFASHLRPRYDAVVVGARCAGAATAMLLARRGLRVLAVDRGRHGADTLSTHALMRGAVLQLQRWGLLGAVQAMGTPAVRTTSFHYEDDALRIAIKPRDGIEALYAPRRCLLDALLVDAAQDAGAHVVHGMRLVDLTCGRDGRVEGALLEDANGHGIEVGAGIVIGADGMRSSVAQRVAAPVERAGRHASGTVYGYWSGLDQDGYHWYYRPGTSVGVIPTNGGLTCVFAATSARRFREELRLDVPTGYRRVIGECSPELAARLAHARREGGLRGFPGQVGFMRRSWGPGWALVGDAAYFKDPITAHGITDALRDAELLARSVAAGSSSALADYQASRDELALDLFRLSDEIASFEWDLDAVRDLHLRLSREMQQEVTALLELHADPAATAPARRSA